MKKYLAWGALAALIVGGGALYAYQRPGMLGHNRVLYNRVPYDVSISADTWSPRVGQTATVRFAVKRNGQPIDLAAQKIYPHATVVSQDAADAWFYHIDELTSPSTGVYEFQHTFTRPTSYRVWLEINDNKLVHHHGQNADYISTFAMQASGPAVAAPVAASSDTPALSREGTGVYHLTVLPYELTANTPGTFKVVAQKVNGKPVALLPHYEEIGFYALANPRASFYVLDHPQENKKGQTEATVGPITFPQPGKYALWIRLFPDDGSGTVTDIAEGSLVLDVK